MNDPYLLLLMNSVCVVYLDESICYIKKVIGCVQGQNSEVVLGLESQPKGTGFDPQCMHIFPSRTPLGQTSVILY